MSGFLPYRVPTHIAPEPIPLEVRFDRRYNHNYMVDEILGQLYIYGQRMPVEAIHRVDYTYGDLDPRTKQDMVASIVTAYAEKSAENFKEVQNLRKEVDAMVVGTGIVEDLQEQVALLTADAAAPRRRWWQRRRTTSTGPR